VGAVLASSNKNKLTYFYRAHKNQGPKELNAPPTSDGDINNKELSITSAREHLKLCKDNFKLPLNFNSEEFRLVANGFFQAEGHISCRIKDKYFSPIFAINQNFSANSLKFFLTL
jgi:hypothetical protein